MRILALGGLLGSIVFAAVTVLCASFRPDYSHIHDFISELGATNTAHAALMNYGGFVPAGLMLVGFGVSLFIALPRSRMTAVGVFFVTLSGTGVLASGFFSCDVGCPRPGGSIENLIHDRLGPLAFASAGIGAVVGLRVFRRGSSPSSTARPGTAADGLVPCGMKARGRYVGRNSR